MSANNTITSKSNMTADMWFRGRYNTTDSGDVTFFICEYLEDTHYNADTGDFFTHYCKMKKRQIEPDECNMDCEPYGKCETCRGFSAVRCQDCVIPRPAK
ncbi:MAG: hypothetical protein HFE90_05240 [Firmicutes bacterium]|nr:hypothetical protein [Bacillota bacterium]